ncbi:MAG: triose-phosphate isomerase [Candidatus Pacebacteria bacterium]|nr:triose-phosphate isomerase [Candidatus Paceibacterota bacterium]
MKKLIIANWKCNPASLKEAQNMLVGLKAGLKNNKAELVVCPPFVYLTEANKILKGIGGVVKIGAQNCFWETAGAYTGEISPLMLKDLGVKYVILGHSERVTTIGETNEMTAKKVKAVLNTGLTPIVCIGETLQEREQAEAFGVIEKELKESTKGIHKKEIEKIIFAYEPLWAISTNQGLICSSDDALTMALYLKKLIGEIYGRKTGQAIKILYGGNINKKNAKNYLENEAISGLLVGGASLNIKEFLSIVKSV